MSLLRPLFALAILVLFSATPTLAQQFDDQTSTRFPSPPALSYSNQVAIEDIDLDGDLDLTFANGGNFFSAGTNQPIRILINDGMGVFADESSRVGFSGRVRDVQYGDVDLDGDPDLIAALDFNAQPRIFVNDGNGNFTDETATRFPVKLLSSSHAALGDVDDDGDLDLWLTNGGPTNRFGAGQAQLWLNDGNGNFTDVTATNLPQQNIDSPMDAIFGDIDGDFDLDMIEGHRDARSRLYRNDGNGVFTDETIGNLPFDQATYSWDFGDINGDGDLDLLGINSQPGNSRELLLANDGTGSFTSVGTLGLPLSANPTVDDNDSKFFDLDYDGDLDFIIASLGSTERIALNDGTGQFSAGVGVIDAVGDSSLDVEIGDLDGDDDLDVVTAQGESGSFVNRVYINVTGSPDDRAPVIIAMDAPTEVGPTGPYRVRAIVRDDMTGDRSFFRSASVVEYTVDGGLPIEVPFRYMGGEIYRGEIPSQLPDSVIEFRLRVTDMAGNTVESSLETILVSREFDRGDCDGDGSFAIADVIASLDAVFSATGPTACRDACDANDDGNLDIGDAIAMLQTLFLGSGPLATPSGACGIDGTVDALGCGVYTCP